jgi:5-hydroxyisourate hydrolase-like protein (transthyretin family)
MATVVPACKKAAAADSYVAIVPNVLFIGKAAAVSVSLLSGGQPAKESIEVTLLKDGKKVTATTQTVNGNGTVTINVPQTAAEGKYEVQVKGAGFTDKAEVSLEDSYVVFIETDKPIYKPARPSICGCFH